ncbi:MAG: hypothetical protein NT004_08560 [Bacteroidetes bacterium]|nr:hypothetical protein [Bacteroidota bacterium]
MKKTKNPKQQSKTTADIKNEPNQVGSIRQRFIWAFFLIVIVFGSSLYSLKNNRQFAMMNGMAEEYLQLGVNMYYSGNFYLSDSAKTPFVFRPPGYVKYLDLVLHSSGEMKPKNYQYQSQEEFDRQKEKVLNVIYFSQCLLLTIASLVIFLLLSEFLSVAPAFAISLMFGVNPYLIMLTGIVHYEILHICLMLISTWLMYLAFARKKFGLVFLVLSAVLWGLTTLVRPVSLILPALFGIMLIIYFGKNWKKSILFFSVFTLVFASTIAPYTYRNYKLLHRIIPVNAQSNIALWAGSQVSLNLDANHYRWWKIWYPDGQEAYEKTTGAKSFETAIYAEHVLELEDQFKSKFKENIASHPMIYIGNICKNFLLLNFGINSVFIKMFQYQQHNAGEINKTWLETGNRQDFYSSEATNVFEILILIMSLMSLAGIYFAIKHNDKLIYIPLAVFLTIVISHSITYMDLMYYYVRIPFLFVFTAFFIKHLGIAFKKSNGILVQKIVAFGLLIYTIFLYMAVI